MTEVRQFQLMASQDVRRALNALRMARKFQEAQVEKTKKATDFQQAYSINDCITKAIVLLKQLESDLSRGEEMSDEG